jgi:hypothetical protein
MAIRSLSDLQASFDAGKFHVQRFQKNAGTAHAKIWADPTFASGQPAYDAHVGSPATFTPCVAQKNDAIYFPGIGTGEERYLAEAQMWASQATFNGPISVVFFDLLGYYPLIDGDSTDTQAFDNTQPLPCRTGWQPSNTPTLTETRRHARLTCQTTGKTSFAPVVVLLPEQRPAP